MIVLHLGTLQRCSFNKFMNLSHCRSITSWRNSWNGESCGVLNKHTQIERDPLIGRTHRIGWKVSQTRFLHKWDHKLPSKKKFLQDDVPESYDLICDTVIYRPYLFWLLPFTFVWSSTMAMVAMVVTVAAIFIVYNYPENFPEKIGGIKTMYAIAGTTISLLLCLSVFQTIHMRRKIVDRLYYNRNTGDFIAISKKGSDKKWNFKSHEVVGKEDVGWKGNFVIKGRHCVVLPEGFSKIGTIKFYNKWCGIE